MKTVGILGTTATLACVLGTLAAMAPEATWAQPVRAASTPAGGCEISSPGSFMDQGFGKEASSVADIIEVRCEPGFAGDKVELSSSELYARCGRRLTWSSPYPYKLVKGPAFKVKLDGYGNTTAAFWVGPDVPLARA